MDNKKKNLEGLNSIFNFLGIHGGKIAIEDDWTFCCKVRNLGDGDYEAELSSLSDDGALRDPFFRVELTFDEERKQVIDYRPIEYRSEWYGGELRIDCIGNLCDSSGNSDYDENDLEERFSSYIGTITVIRPYLTKPKSVEKYEDDVDCTYLGGNPELKKLRREAMARMRILGVSPEDVEKFGKGEYTKIVVDYENMRVRKMAPTQEEIEMVKKVEQESDIPFLAYYIISDTLTWPDGETNTRYILPHVWDEKWDNDSDKERKEGELWGRVRRNMLQYKMIPCYVVNADIPDYSEFGELPYQMLDGMLFTVG